jgi:hypothetical protein
MQWRTVIAEPQNEINKDNERRRNQGGQGTGIWSFMDDAKEGGHCYYRLSFHLVAVMSRTKTTAAMTATSSP